MVMEGFDEMEVEVSLQQKLYIYVNMGAQLQICYSDCE